MMKQVASFGVPMCQPIEFGTCDEGVYSIQSWIDGAAALTPFFKEYSIMA